MVHIIAFFPRSLLEDHLIQCLMDPVISFELWVELRLDLNLLQAELKLEVKKIY